MAVAILVSEINGQLEPSREKDQTNNLAHDGIIFSASLMGTPHSPAKVSYLRWVIYVTMKARKDIVQWSHCL